MNQVNPNVLVDPQGVGRCRKIITTAMENVPGDPSKGCHNVKAYCNRPVTFCISENRMLCPQCDPVAKVGQVAPGRVTNANGIVLTADELKETSIVEAPLLIPEKIRKPRKAMEARVKKARADAVELEVLLDELESGCDITAMLVKRVIDGLDNLPVTNFKESKRLLKVQEMLQKLLEV
jgi:hypothetical protein